MQRTRAQLLWDNRKLIEERDSLRTQVKELDEEVSDVTEQLSSKINHWRDRHAKLKAALEEIVQFKFNHGEAQIVARRSLSRNDDAQAAKEISNG